jgi:hypothetical protein
VPATGQGHHRRAAPRLGCVRTAHGSPAEADYLLAEVLERQPDELRRLLLRTPVLAGLTAMDRCDRCGAQAYVWVLLPNGLELLFCAHHSRQHPSALMKIAVGIHDETCRLARRAA